MIKDKEAIPLPSNPETEAFRSPNQEQAMKNPISLNPFVSEFKGTPLPRPEESYFPLGAQTNERYRNQDEGFGQHSD